MVCVSTRREDWDTEWVWDVFVLDASAGGSEPRCVTDSAGTCAAPAWSPDGQWIAYYANECPYTAYAQDYYLWLAPAAGGAARNVSRPLLDRGCQASQPPSVNEPPHWSADSQTVFCTIRQGGFFHYSAYDLATNTLRAVHAPRDVAEPVDGWVRQTADGAPRAFTGATGVRPSEVYTLSGDGVRAVTNLNEALDVRAPERLTHTSPEGWEVESWLWLPPGYRSGDAPLPTVLYYHGGPHNTVALGFNETMHVLAGAGFAVVGVNFRGSTGFGAAYADSILGDWGTRELADGLAIVDALVEQGRRRCAATGRVRRQLWRLHDQPGARAHGPVRGWCVVRDHLRDRHVGQSNRPLGISRLGQWRTVVGDSGVLPIALATHVRCGHSGAALDPARRSGLSLLRGGGRPVVRRAAQAQAHGRAGAVSRRRALLRAHGPPSYRLDALQRVVGWFERYLLI